MLPKLAVFYEDEVRVVGRTARGVRGMNLEDGQYLVSAIALRQQDDEHDILTVSENGYGKRTQASQFPRRSRGTKGVIAMQTSDRNGKLIGASWVTELDEVMFDIRPGNFGAHPNKGNIPCWPQYSRG